MSHRVSWGTCDLPCALQDLLFPQILYLCMGSVAVVDRLSCPAARGVFVPRSGTALHSRFLTTGPSGKSLSILSRTDLEKLWLGYLNISLIEGMPSFLDCLDQWFWGFWIVSYTPLVCFHLFPPNLIFLLLGQCIRYKTQTELKCSLKDFALEFPASGARVYLQSECLEVMGSGFLLLFFLTSISATVLW